MLATAGTVPVDDDRWAYEVKFDGIRALAYVDSQVRLESRNGNDITVAWPELAGLAPAEPGFVVDGEIVIEQAGRSSFKALAPRMHQRNPVAIGALATSTRADPAGGPALADPAPAARPGHRGAGDVEGTRARRDRVARV
ncbi:ATP-dependent DNA ligase [Nocardia thailandica]